MKVLDVDTDTYLESHLLEHGEIKLRKSIRDHDHSTTTKGKDNEHVKIRIELDKRIKNITKNMEYRP